MYECCWLSEALTLAVAAGVGKICGSLDLSKRDWFCSGQQMWSQSWRSGNGILDLGIWSAMSSLVPSLCLHFGCIPHGLVSSGEATDKTPLTVFSGLCDWAVISYIL